jgi:hypothetical protein
MIEFRDRALRGIGRNVVNFQRLEQCIMFVSLFAGIEGPLPKVICDQNKRIERISKHTLGQAVLEIQRIIEKDERPLPTTKDLFDPWVSTSFEFVLDRSVARQHCEELSVLVHERNGLVHHRMATVDFDSIEQCTLLSEELDSQNCRILEHLGAFGSLVTELRQMLAEHNEYANSVQFLAQLQRPCEDDV